MLMGGYTGTVLGVKEQAFAKKIKKKKKYFGGMGASCFLRTK